MLGWWMGKTGGGMRRYRWWTVAVVGFAVIVWCLCVPIWPQHNVTFDHRRIAGPTGPTEFTRYVPCWESDYFAWVLTAVVLASGVVGCLVARRAED
jgi:hypothetical protein